VSPGRVVCGRTRDDEKPNSARPSHRPSVTRSAQKFASSSASAQRPEQPIQWANLAPGTMPRRLRSVNATGWLTIESAKIDVASPSSRHHGTLYVKNGEECGSSAAPYTTIPGAQTAVSQMRNAVIHTGEIRRLKRLTVPRAKAYIGPLGRTAALARWRVRETLTVYAVNHPAMSHGHVGCAGIGGSGSCRSLRILDGAVRFRAV
jgi:hypothetical protein